jgi:imidazoleglycerol-phosphate dehydratase
LSVKSGTTIQRTAKMVRTTKETSVRVKVNIDGTGKTTVNAPQYLSFIEHLISIIGKYSMTDIALIAKSNDGIVHHLVEDISIGLSQALDKALRDRSQITRFGYAMVPMDESLAYVAVDLIKRQFCNIQLNLTRNTIEGIAREDLEHFIRSLAQNLNACIHMVVEYGDNDHHKLESAIKAFGVAFRMAASIDKKRKEIPSTKGAM